MKTITKHVEEKGGELFSNKMSHKAYGFASSALFPAPLSLSDEAGSAHLAGQQQQQEEVRVVWLDGGHASGQLPPTSGWGCTAGAKRSSRVHAPLGLRVSEQQGL